MNKTTKIMNGLFNVGPLVSYLASSIILALTISLQFFLSNFLEWTAFLLLYPVVFIIAWTLGPRPGTFATIIGAFSADLMFIQPRWELLARDPGDYLGLIIFICMGLSFSWAISRYQILLKETIVSKNIAEKSQLELQNIIEASPTAIGVKNIEGEIILINSKGAEIFGKSKNEILHHRIENLLPPDKIESMNEMDREILKTKSTVTFEEILPAKNGSEKDRDLYTIKFPLCDKEGNPYGICRISTDITTVKEADRAIKESWERMKLFIENAPVAIAMFDKEMRYLASSKQWSKMYKLKENYLGCSHYSVFPNLPEYLKEVHRRALAGEFLGSDGDKIDIGNGVILWTKWRTYPWKDHRGKIGGIVISTENITRQKELEENLRQSIADRDDFISIVSHELKTPLTALKLQTQMAIRKKDKSQNKSYDTEEINNVLEQTDKQLNKLVRLVDDLLDISRIRTGKLTINKERIELCQLTLELIDRLRENFNGANTMLEFHCNDVVEGNWDRLRIEQVITNLLTNAIRYGEGRSIVVSVSRNKDLAYIRVRDHGRGINEDTKERIFGRYERAVIAREISGMGIGLFISRQLVEAHGGKIWVESEGTDKGSTFTVELPI